MNKDPISRTNGSDVQACGCQDLWSYMDAFRVIRMVISERLSMRASGVRLYATGANSRLTMPDRTSYSVAGIGERIGDLSTRRDEVAQIANRYSAYLTMAMQPSPVCFEG